MELLIILAVWGVFSLTYRIGGSRLTLGALVAASLVFSAWMSWPPDRVALTQECQPDGFWPKLSETLHEKRFWERQHSEIRSARHAAEGTPARMAEMVTKGRAMASEVVAKSTIESEYFLDPRQRLAAALRRKADELDRNNTDVLILDMFTRSSAERVEWLSKCEGTAFEKSGLATKQKNDLATKRLLDLPISVPIAN